MLSAKFISVFGVNNAKNQLINRTRQQILPSLQREYRPVPSGPEGVQPYVRFSGKPNRHKIFKFAHMRARKVIKVDLSQIRNYDDKLGQENAEKIGPEEIRAYLKKKGVPPVRPYKDRGRDRPMHVSSTSSVFEAYVPPEGDGRASRLTREGVGQLWDHISSKSRELIKHVRTVRRYDLDFDPKTFGETIAVPVFTEAHKALMDRDIERLHEFVTEHAFSIMHDENRLRSIRWELIESMEPARVVHVRASGVLHDDNIFGQVTVRMHTKQKLAIYDQFGRLSLGSIDVARDVLEYVVFERHLVDPYGAWRLHSKITPKWLPPKEGVIKTFKMLTKSKRHDVGDDVETEELVPVPDEEGDKPGLAKV